MPNNHRHFIHKGYTLIELLIVIAILGLGYSAILPAATEFIYLQYATITMRQLQQAINYARSMAILQRQKVTLCPSYNRFNCCGSWQQGVLVLAPNGTRRYFDIYVAAGGLLTLQQSGFSNNKVDIQANGMTYTNGHFTYRSLNSRYIPQFNLYFNRALRTYIVWGSG